MILKDVCGLIVAAGVGAGSVVAVQQVRQPAPAAVSKPAKPVKTAISRVRSAPAAAAATPSLLPAPTCTPSVFNGPDTGPALPSVTLADIPGLSVFPDGPLIWGPNPSGGGGAQIPISIVPEPGYWGMMISGFGLIGLALRRVRRPGTTRPESMSVMQYRD